MKTIKDAIYGVAVADALGVPVEFMCRGSYRVEGMSGYGSHNQPVGTWSDDTSLTLALQDSIRCCHEMNYEDMMGRFSDWLMYADYTASGEVFDVGISTSKAIMNYGKGIPPIECGGRAENENGNGSLMRIIPVVFYLNELDKSKELTQEQKMNIIHEVSSLTHGHERSLIGCGIYVLIALELLMENGSIYECVRNGIETAQNYYGKDPRYLVDFQHYSRMFDIRKFKILPEELIQSSGYIVDSLEAAVWCLMNTCSYAECVLKAVNLGEDTDTVGAVAGGLAGIVYGYDKIPKIWIEKLKNKELIEKCLF